MDRVASAGKLVLGATVLSSMQQLEPGEVHEVTLVLS